MAVLYTKNGKPLTVSSNDVFDRSGRQVGRRRGSKIYGPDGLKVSNDVHSGCGSVVLVHEAAKPIEAVDMAVPRSAGARA